MGLEPALKSSNTKKWVDQHLIHTQKGSAIIGVAHVPDLNDTKSLEMKVLSKNILPKVMQVAEKAIKELHGKDAGGRAMVVNEARPQEKKEFAPRRPFNNTDLYPYFTGRIKENKKPY